jgi:hypothetical protein
MRNSYRIYSSVLMLFKVITVLALMVGAAGGAASSYAVSLTWTNGSGNWTSTTAWTTNTATSSDGVTTNFCDVAVPIGFVVITNCAGGTGGFPSSGDQAYLTNDGPYAIRVNSPISNLEGLSVLNSLVTIDAANSLNVTGLVRIGYNNGTTTVYLAGGTCMSSAIFGQVETRNKVQF